jgi:hypothetical protein
MRDERAGEASPATLSPCATTVVTAWSQPGQDELSTQKMSHTHLYRAKTRYTCDDMGFH